MVAAVPGEVFRAGWGFSVRPVPQEEGFSRALRVPLSEGIVWCWAEVGCLLRRLLPLVNEATHPLVVTSL